MRLEAEDVVVDAEGIHDAADVVSVVDVVGNSKSHAA